MGHLQSRAGHLLAKAGHLLANCACCEPANPCAAACPDGTPDKLYATIAGSSVIGPGCHLSDAGGPAAPFLGAISGSGGSFDGTYELTRGPSGFGQCSWVGSLTGPVIDYYGTDAPNDCSSPPTASVSTWTIILYKNEPVFPSTDYTWGFVVFGTFTGAIGAGVYLFHDGPNFAGPVLETGVSSCTTSLPTFTNSAVGGFEEDTRVEYYPGYGGTATISV